MSELSHCFRSQIPGEFNDLFFYVSGGHLSETGELEGYCVYRYSSIGAHPNDWCILSFSAHPPGHTQTLCNRARMSHLCHYCQKTHISQSLYIGVAVSGIVAHSLSSNASKHYAHLYRNWFWSGKSKRHDGLSRNLCNNDCTYEGAYHKGIRQGSGVYRYGKNNEGGVYMGEWLEGKMHGCGFMLYPHAQHYIRLSSFPHMNLCSSLFFSSPDKYEVCSCHTSYCLRR